MPIFPGTEFLADLEYPEGPRWHDGRLWFSDVFGLKVSSVSAAGGQLRVEAHVPNRPSGLGWLPDGRLLVVSMRDKRLLRQESDGSMTTVADLSGYYERDANDMVVDREGRAYITSLNRNTKIVLVEPNGNIRPVGEEMSGPNGCVITPDGRTFIVAEPGAHRLIAYQIEQDGSLTNRWTFAEFTDLSPDGICLDVEGAVWFGSPMSEQFVRVKEGGEVLDRVEIKGKWTVAPVLGGHDLRTLYMCTADVENDDWTKGKSVGWIETAVVSVPGT